MKQGRYGRIQRLNKGFYGILVILLVMEAAILGRSIIETKGNIIASKAGTTDDEVEEKSGESTKEQGNHVQQEPAPKIALTFDDGPSIYTEELLDGLKERDAKATFFVIGKSAENYPEIVTREALEGHLVGNHTYNHVQITGLRESEAREEVEKTNAILEKLIKKRVEYVRPPFGIWEEHLEDLDMMSVMWTIDPLDWTTKNADEIVNKVVTQTEENDIILLHDCYKSSVQAALRIVDILQSEGFEFVTVDRLFIE